MTAKRTDMEPWASYPLIAELCDGLDPRDAGEVEPLERLPLVKHLQGAESAADFLASMARAAGFHVTVAREEGPLQ